MPRQCKIILHCQPMTTMYSATSSHFIPLSLYDMKDWWFLIGWPYKIILHRRCISIKLIFYYSILFKSFWSLSQPWSLDLDDTLFSYKLCFHICNNNNHLERKKKWIEKINFFFIMNDYCTFEFLLIESLKVVWRKTTFPVIF
jgi:hypothetical protein